MLFCLALSSSERSLSAPFPVEMPPPSVNLMTVVFTPCETCQAASLSLTLCLTPRMSYNYVEIETAQDLNCPFSTAKLLLYMYSGKRVSSSHQTLLVDNVFDKMA